MTSKKNGRTKRHDQNQRSDYNPNTYPQAEAFSLAKPSRSRRQKRGWQRGARGWIDRGLLAEMALLVVVVGLYLAGASA